MGSMLKKYQSYIVTVIVAVAATSTLTAFSQSIKFNSIKPDSSAAPLTDEQQAILAVRTAKASVVNIIGVENPTASTASSSLAIIGTSPNEVLGTGFVYDSSGLIITNNHVVEQDNMSYTVVLSDVLNTRRKY